MNRAATATALGVRLGKVLARAGIAAEDSEGNLKEPIDDTLRILGYTEAELADPETDVPAITVLPVARCLALRAARERLITLFDVSIEGDSYRRNQIVGNVERLLADACADVDLILAGAPTGASPFVTVDLNYKDAPDLEDWG